MLSPPLVLSPPLRLLTGQLTVGARHPPSNAGLSDRYRTACHFEGRRIRQRPARARPPVGDRLGEDALIAGCEAPSLGLEPRRALIGEGNSRLVEGRLLLLPKLITDGGNAIDACSAGRAAVSAFAGGPSSSGPGKRFSHAPSPPPCITNDAVVVAELVIAFVAE